MTLVCPQCGSKDIRMTGKHGWVECLDYGCEGYAVDEGDFEPSESQQGLIPIPDGYDEP